MSTPEVKTERLDPPLSSSTPSPLDFPSIASHVEDLDVAAEGLTKEANDLNDSVKSFASSVPRKHRRESPSGPAELEIGCVSMAAYLAAQLPPDADRTAFLEELFSPVLRMPFGRDSVIMLTQTATHVANRQRVYSESVATSITNVHEDTKDPKNGYKLMKILAQTAKTERGQEHDKAINWFQGIAAYSTIAEAPENLVEKTILRLRTGEFDSSIAEELIRNSISHDGDRSPSQDTSQDLVRLVKLIQAGRTISEEEAIEFLANEESVALWPEYAHAKLETKKQVLEQKITANVSMQIGELESKHLIPQKANREEFDSLLLEWIRETTKMLNGGASFGMQPHKAISIAAEQSRKRRGQRARRRVGQTATEPEVVKTSEPKKLYSVGPNGKKIPEDSPDFQKMKNEYLDTHPGDQKLRDDVESILEYLRKLDYAQGVIKGVRKYAGTIDVGGEKRDVYGLKVKFATGLSTGSPHAKKIRVLFVKDETEIGVIGILDRDDVVTFERRHGISSGHEK